MNQSLTAIDSSVPAGAVAHSHEDIIYPDTIAFAVCHLAVLAVFFTGVNPIDIAICVSLYIIRIWGITAGFHRYFSHRTYQTSRWFQFVLAWIGGMSAQRGALWWASSHRLHHKFSDTAYDVHSPRQHGFWFSHVGWIFTKQTQERDYSNIQDLTQYPELVWLDKHKYFPAIVTAVAVWLIAGWSGLIVGFFLSTVLTWHGTFLINSLAHVYGKQRYVTGDDSRNNWFLALLTLGEGWHNNHHYYQSAARNGFRWYEIDITYYSIVILSWLGITWDLKQPSPEVIAGDRRLPKPLADRAKEIYASMQHSLDGFADRGRDALDTAGSRWDHFTESGRVAVRQALNDLAHRFDEVAHSVAEKVEPVREKARETMHQAAMAAEGQAERAREAMHHAHEAMEEAAERAKKAFSEATEALEVYRHAYSVK